MASWREDFSTCSFEEVLESQAENRAWGDRLRNKTSQLVNSRLANEISWADYLESRKVAIEDTAECRRRAAILQTQLLRGRLGLAKA
jgi:hypothetical protein